MPWSGARWRNNSIEDRERACCCASKQSSGIDWCSQLADLSYMFGSECVNAVFIKDDFNHAWSKCTLIVEVWTSNASLIGTVLTESLTRRNCNNHRPRGLYLRCHQLPYVGFRWLLPSADDHWHNAFGMWNWLNAQLIVSTWEKATINMTFYKQWSGQLNRLGYSRPGCVDFDLPAHLLDTNTVMTWEV